MFNYTPCHEKSSRRVHITMKSSLWNNGWREEECKAGLLTNNAQGPALIKELTKEPTGALGGRRKNCTG